MVKNYEIRDVAPAADQWRVVLSVSRLNRATKLILSEGLGDIWVEGEISNFSRPHSGHWYFSLKDSEAQVRCVMFKPRNRLFPGEPRDGDHVVVLAQASLYEPRGDFQLIVEHMEGTGDGALRLAFEALKRKLEAEGLFAPERKQAIPKFPRCVGLITSPTGAAIHDMLTVLKRRYPALPVIVFPTAVQGAQAKNEIAGAIAAADASGLCDTLLLARGGGALEDLWAFNEEIVARAIAACQTPIVTGIGHEVDFTIADFVADLRAPTPSVAAESVSPDASALAACVVKLSQTVNNRMQAIVQRLVERERWLAKRLDLLHPRRQLELQSQRTDERELRLRNAMTARLRWCQSATDREFSRLQRQSPDQRLLEYRLRLRNALQRLQDGVARALADRRQRLVGVQATLDAISPLATLDRGYALVFRVSDGKLIRDPGSVDLGETTTTRFAGGSLISTVTERIVASGEFAR